MNELFSLENKYRKNANANTITDEFGNKKISVGVLDRVSTDTQAIEGDSLEMQRELAQDYVKSINGEIYKFYTEEGISASKTRIEKRQKLQELIQDIQNGNVNYVVAYKRDRIFRNAQEYMWFIQFLVDHNCEIYLTARDEQQIDLSAFKIAGASKLMEVMMAMISEMESETTSSRVSDTMINLAKKGEYTGGSTPIGYRRESGKFVPIEGVKELFYKIENLYLRGYGKFSIARWLNGGVVKGLKTLDKPIPKPIEHKSSETWNHRNIETILFNPIYTGHFSYQSKKNIDLDRLISKSELIEPIRTEERQREISLFKIQKTSNSKPPRAYNTPFLLSGLLYCSECGEKMITSTTQPKGSKKTHSYYRCASKAKQYLKGKCSSKNYSKETIEAMAIKLAVIQIRRFLESDTLSNIKLKQEVDKSLYAEKADTIQNKIKSCEKKINRYDSLIEKLDDSNDEGDIELQRYYMKKQKELLININNLKIEHEEISIKSKEDKSDKFNIDDLAKLANEFINHVENKPVGEQKRMLERLFSKLYVDKNGNIKLMIKVGLTDDLLKEVESNDNDTDVISFSPSGSPIIIKDIKYVINAMVIEFNYYEYVNKLANLVYENLLAYLSIHDEYVLIDNALNINTSQIKQFKIPKFKDQKRLKRSIHYQYMMNKYPLHHRALECLLAGDRLSLNTINEMLKINKLTMTDYLEYLKSHPEMIVDEKVIEQCILISKSVDVVNQPLFKDKIKCVCGGTCLKRRNVKGISYECECKRRKRCKVKNVKEKDIILKIESDKNAFIQTHEDVDNLVERIELTNSDAEFRIFYK